MTVGQVEYLQDLSDGQLRISDFHISSIGFIYFRQVYGTFRQVIFTIHLPDGQVHSIWNFEAWNFKKDVSNLLDSIYCQTSNISYTLASNKIAGHSEEVGASPVGAAPFTSSLST